MIAAATRLSPLHDALAPLAPAWQSVHEVKAPWRLTAVADETAAASQAAVCDLSALARFTVKGAKAETWLADRGVVVPEPLYARTVTGDDGMVARLGQHEYFIEDGLTTAVAGAMSACWQTPPADVWPICRQDAAIALVGRQAAAALAQTCSILLRELPDDQVVLTRAAAVSVMLAKRSWGPHSGVQIWCDPSYGAYLWHELLQIVRELGGDAVGWACLFGQTP